MSRKLETAGQQQAKRFYEKAFLKQEYAALDEGQEHPFYRSLTDFIQQYGLAQARALEVGCGRGSFQHLVADYHGVDLALSARAYLTRPFAVAAAGALPYANNSFDAVWSVTVIEHVPDPEAALSEMWRVLRPGGYLYLAPAWQCRAWAADGYPVRPYSDFGLRGKLIKLSIPLRDSLPYRAAKLAPFRLARLVQQGISRRPTTFRYRSLQANYDTFWMADSDACNSMDPFEAIVWYQSRGGKCLNYPTRRQALLVRTGALMFQKASS